MTCYRPGERPEGGVRPAESARVRACAHERHAPFGGEARGPVGRASSHERSRENRVSQFCRLVCIAVGHVHQCTVCEWSVCVNRVRICMTRRAKYMPAPPVPNATSVAPGGLDLAHPGTRSISTAPARISCRTLMLGCSPHPLIHTLVASGGDGHGSW